MCHDVRLISISALQAHVESRVEALVKGVTESDWREWGHLGHPQDILEIFYDILPRDGVTGNLSRPFPEWRPPSPCV